MTSTPQMDTQNQVEIVTLPLVEWRAFREVRLRALAEDPQAFRRTYAEAAALPDAWWQEQLQEVADGRNWLFFARLGGDIAGMMGARRAEGAEATAAIWGVHVLRALRGHGIGGQLMARMLHELRAAGIARVTLTVKKEQVAAVELYKRFGLAIVGDGRDQAEYVMARRL